MRVPLFAAAALAIAAAGPAERFDVASIKPNREADSRLRMQHLPGGTFHATAATLAALVRFAYGVRDLQVVGAQGWMSSERFDIAAKAEGAPEKVPEEQSQRMLQALLAERFRLKVHRESKEMPIYALVVSKSGAKLKPWKGSPEQIGPTRQGLARVRTTTIGGLCGLLTSSAGRLVVDETGLKGEYDIAVEFVPGRLNGEAPPPDNTGPTIFVAVQEQLGLKLESRRGPIEMIVIDGAEKPTEN